MSRISSYSSWKDGLSNTKLDYEGTDGLISNINVYLKNPVSGEDEQDIAEEDIEGDIEETVIHVKIEEDNMSVGSVADLESRIRTLYFKVKKDNFDENPHGMRFLCPPPPPYLSSTIFCTFVAGRYFSLPLL